MNDDAFARRFYADRAELESLGIDLKVDKPADGSYEAESYTLPPENFYLPAIEFSDAELGALRMALSLLDGEFAYAEPLRLALQQLSWGKPSPLGGGGAPARRPRPDRRGRRPRAVAAAVEDRDRDLPAQDDRVRLLHDRPRRGGEAQGRPVPAPLPARPVLFDRVLARAPGHPRVPAVADPRQGVVLVEGRARLLAPRGLRPPLVRDPHGLAARRAGGHGAHLAVAARGLADRAPLRPRRHASSPRRTRRTRRATTARCSRPSTRTRARSWRGCSSWATAPACSARRAGRPRSGAARADRGAPPRHVRDGEVEGRAARARPRPSPTTARASRRSARSASRGSSRSRAS